MAASRKPGKRDHGSTCRNSHTKQQADRVGDSGRNLPCDLDRWLPLAAPGVSLVMAWAAELESKKKPNS